MAACDPAETMLKYHRRQNPDGPYRQELCASPAETGAGWDCPPERVAQLRREARALVRRARVALYLQALAEARSELVWRWQLVANCESGDDPHINTGNGYYGWLQFLPSTWASVGGTGLPSDHGREEQAYRAEILKNRAGLGQWPVCGRYYR